MAAKRKRTKKKAKGRKGAAKKKPSRKKAKRRAKKRPARKKARKKAKKKPARKKAKRRAKKKPAAKKRKRPAKKKAAKKKARKKAKRKPSTKKKKAARRRRVGGKVDVREARIVLDDKAVERARRVTARAVRDFTGKPNAARRLSNEAEELSAQALEALSAGKLKRAIDLAVRASGLLAAIPKVSPRSAVARALLGQRFTQPPLNGAIKKLAAVVARAAAGQLGGVMLLGGDLGTPP